MPPKNAGGSKKPKANVNAGATKAEPQPVNMRGIADLEVPRSTVTKLAKSFLPDNVKVSKEVPIALVRASTVFISYISALSQEAAFEKSNKTINAAHVLDAVEKLGWEEGPQLCKLLEKELAAYKANVAAKKAGKSTATPEKKPQPRLPKGTAALLSPTEDEGGAEATSFTAEGEAEGAASTTADAEEGYESFGEPEEEPVPPPEDEDYYQPELDVPAPSSSQPPATDAMEED